jgi:hypothetical protein
MPPFGDSITFVAAKRRNELGRPRRLIENASNQSSAFFPGDYP